MDSAFSLKDIVLVFIVPVMGYIAYAVYKMNGTLSSFKAWAEGHEKIDVDRHDAVIRELNAVQARLK